LKNAKYRIQLQSFDPEEVSEKEVKKFLLKNPKI